MSFQLDVSPGAITRPARLDLAPIEAAMLWPDDEEQRNKFWKAAVVRTFREIGMHNHDGSLLAQVMETEATLPKLAELSGPQQTEKRFAHGAIAGRMILEAVLSAQDFRAVTERIATTLWNPQDKVFLIRPQTMKNKAGPITKFRAVAHLWAAHLMTADEGRGVFPCEVADLPRFLGTAEELRSLAEAKRLPNSHHMVMKPGVAVTLSQEVAALLPRVSIIGA